MEHSWLPGRGVLRRLESDEVAFVTLRVDNGNEPERVAALERTERGEVEHGGLGDRGRCMMGEARSQSPTRPARFVYTQRVRPQECAASTNLGHPRFLEFFEAAFIECWRDLFGSLTASLGPERGLTVAAVDVRYLEPVRVDDELRIEVALERITERSIHVQYDAYVGDTDVAKASSRYVCLDSESGKPAALPDWITRA